MDKYEEIDFLSEKSKKFKELEWTHGCHNYHPMPVVLDRAEGCYMYDVDGKQYLDFLAGYSTLNQGHCHPKIVKAACDQIHKLTLTARAFFNNKLGVAEECLTKLTGFDKVCFMNTGVEGGETAVKFARRWGYTAKKIPPNQAKVIFCNGNFWGRTIAACGSSDDPGRFKDFGPFEGLKFDLIKYNDPAALEAKFKEDPYICAFMVEPIQGEAGCIVPDKGYLKKVRELCTKYNVLLICDEVQTGMGRTGKFLCYQWEGIKPDIAIMGKALSGGIMPISCVLADNKIMDCIHPGDHGSTFGGNPLAAEISATAIKVLLEEKMVENSEHMGEYFRKLLKDIKHPLLKDVRGKGLFNAIEVTDGAWQLCLYFLKNGLLTKPTHDNIIRLAPPLIITREQCEAAAAIIKKSLDELEAHMKAGKPLIFNH